MPPHDSRENPTRRQVEQEVIKVNPSIEHGRPRIVYEDERPETEKVPGRFRLLRSRLFQRGTDFEVAAEVMMYVPAGLHHRNTVFVHAPYDIAVAVGDIDVAGSALGVEVVER